MKFFKNPTVIIIILGVIFGTVFYLFSGRSDSTTTEETKSTAEEQAETTADSSSSTESDIVNLTNVDPADFANEIKTELALADAQAKIYNPGEVLSAIEIILPADLKPRTGQSTYIYSAPNDSTFNYTITITQNSINFLRSIVYKEDYFGSVTTINQNSWKLNYVEAIKVAEENGGKEWRSSHSLTKVRLVLKNAEPKGWLYWFVYYQSEEKTLQIQIDAFTGKKAIDNTEMISS
jgi:hypothetical protein